MSIEQHVHILLIVDPHNRGGSRAHYKGWISGSTHFTSLEPIPHIFPMAEAANPYTFRQDESACPQYQDPEKFSVTEGKVYDGGY